MKELVEYIAKAIVNKCMLPATGRPSARRGGALDCLSIDHTAARVRRRRPGLQRPPRARRLELWGTQIAQNPGSSLHRRAGNQ